MNMNNHTNNVMALQNFDKECIAIFFVVVFLHTNSVFVLAILP